MITKSQSRELILKAAVMGGAVADCAEALGLPETRALGLGHLSAREVISTFSHRFASVAAAGAEARGFPDLLPRLKALSPNTLVYLMPYAAPTRLFTAFFLDSPPELLGCTWVTRRHTK